MEVPITRQRRGPKKCQPGKAAPCDFFYDNHYYDNTADDYYDGPPISFIEFQNHPSSSSHPPTSIVENLTHMWKGFCDPYSLDIHPTNTTTKSIFQPDDDNEHQWNLTPLSSTSTSSTSAGSCSGGGSNSETNNNLQALPTPPPLYNSNTEDDSSKEVSVDSIKLFLQGVVDPNIIDMVDTAIAANTENAASKKQKKKKSKDITTTSLSVTTTTSLQSSATIPTTTPLLNPVPELASPQTPVSVLVHQYEAKIRHSSPSPKSGNSALTSAVKKTSKKSPAKSVSFSLPPPSPPSPPSLPSENDDINPSNQRGMDVATTTTTGTSSSNDETVQPSQVQKSNATTSSTVDKISNSIKEEAVPSLQLQDTNSSSRSVDKIQKQQSKCHKNISFVIIIKHYLRTAMLSVFVASLLMAVPFVGDLFTTNYIDYPKKSSFHNRGGIENGQRLQPTIQPPQKYNKIEI